MGQYRYALDLQLFAGEKTEKATPKRKQEARKKGQVAKSQDISGAFILLFSFLFLLAFGGLYKGKLLNIYIQTYRDYMLAEATVPNVLAMFYQLVYQSLLVVGPFMVMAVATALFANYLQVGFLLTGEPLLPKFGKLNPVEGMKRIFSLRSLVEFLKTMLKLAIIGVIVFYTLWQSRTQVLALARLPLAGVFKFTAQMVVSLGVKIAAVLVLLAFLDYLYQRYEQNKSLRMSKQDIKDELKTTEGDPLIKGKIREKQRRMAISRMMQEVPKADVVITNPTHFAVALRYDSGEMDAPCVIAKGQDFVALKIKEIAQKHEVAIMENKPLARALYSQVEVGEAIPQDLFQAVAEVLAFVYRMKKRKI
ncbi:MAG TPA: flagellar biosynthesis protein FlhB [Bacilli bacterium]